MRGMSQVFAPSCANNQAPILAVLQHALADRTHVLEIGSGTGQHSVYFAPRLPHLVWQTSDLLQHHASIQVWHAAEPAPNLRAPLVLEIGGATAWPQTDDGPFDAVFTSNTLHIMGWPQVQQLLALVGQQLPPGGVLAVYGPFNYGGRYTSDSNRAFDASLRARDAASGLRDQEAVVAQAQQQGLLLRDDHAMPANNRTLVFEKHA
jgi:SAM-dependent methyltransferase